MKSIINPILKKEIKVSSRSIKLSFSLLGYTIANMIIFIFTMMVISTASGGGGENIHRMLMYVFPILGITQSVIVIFVTPLLTASSISGERERQTFEIMMTTCMSPISIVTGKLVSSMANILLYVVACIPIMSISFILGGAKFSSLIIFFLDIILLSLLSGSIGVFCSTLCRKTIVSIILSYVMNVFIYFITAVPCFIASFIAAILSFSSFDFIATSFAKLSFLCLLLNPAVYMEEFFAKILLGTSFFSSDLVNELTSIAPIDFLFEALTFGPVWSIISAIGILITSTIFILAAAWIIDPMHGSGK